VGGVLVAGGSIYIAGSYGPDFEHKRPCYWVDGALTDLPVPEGRPYAAANNILVSEGSVAVSGEYGSNWDQDVVPCYWVDGKRVDLSVPGGKNSLLFTLEAPKR
jgi:hypothetical protein